MATAAALTGNAVGLGRTDPAGLALTATAACVGLGTLVLGVVGQAPFAGGSLRIGLGLLGVGLLAVCVSAILAGLATTDPLSSLPIVSLAVAGFGLTPIGWLITGIALLADGPRSRIVGALVVAGTALVVVGVLAGNGGTLVGTLVGTLSLVGVGLVVLGAFGIGVLTVTSDHGPR